MPLAHPSTLDHLSCALERGWWVSSWRGLEPGARRGRRGPFSLGRGLDCVRCLLQAGHHLLGSDFGHKKGDQLVALAKVRSASRSYRVSLPTRTGPGVNPHARSQCCLRVPIEAWMSAELFISAEREPRDRLGRCQGAQLRLRPEAKSMRRLGAWNARSGSIRKTAVHVHRLHRDGTPVEVLEGAAPAGLAHRLGSGGIRQELVDAARDVGGESGGIGGRA